MDAGNDTARVIVDNAADIGKEVAKSGIKLLGKAILSSASFTLEAVLDLIKDTKTREAVERIMNSGQEVKTVEIGKEDIDFLKKQAKLYGMDIAIIKDKSNDRFTAMFRGDMLGFMEEILAKRIKEKANDNGRESVNEKMDNIKAGKAKEQAQNTGKASKPAPDKAVDISGFQR